MNDPIGDRIKENYEAPSRHLLLRRTPVIVRVDGRAFHTFTKGFKKPFDSRLIDSMVISATCLASEMQGFKMGYVQSDEASFVLTDYDKLTTQPWFGYVKSKMETISAAKMTFMFARCMRLANVNEEALFDARAFNIPEAEVANYFLWRSKDWRRNSMSMYARTWLSHRELFGKSTHQVLELLASMGHYWYTSTLPEERNGTFLVTNKPGSIVVRDNIEPNYKAIAELWDGVKSCEPTTCTNVTSLNTTSEAADENSSASNTRNSDRDVGDRGNGIPPKSNGMPPLTGS